MAKFLFLYRESAQKSGPEPTPDQMQEVMQAWWSWLGAGKAAGWVLEMGEALSPEGGVVDADNKVTDGPFVETREIVGGYTLVEAKDLKQACGFAQGCPIFGNGGRVEVRAIMDLPQP